MSSDATSGTEFERLVLPHRGELQAHCYRLLGSFHDAEDVVQEVLARAWRKLDQLDDPTRVRPWLYRIATNQCVTLAGRSARHRELPTDLTADTTDAGHRWLEPYPTVRQTDHADPESSYERRESVELAFVSMLQLLPPRQRAVLLLRDVIGFSAAECAHTLGTSEPAVHSALQRARRAVAAKRAPTSQQHEQRRMGAVALQDLAQRFSAAWEAADLDGLLALLHDDVIYTMPPVARWYHGRAAVREFLLREPMQYSWRLVQVEANAQLAFATYRQDPGDTLWVPAGVDVLDITGGRVSRIVSFLDEGLFPDFVRPDSDVTARTGDAPKR